MKIGIFCTHPIQYKAPLFRILSLRNNLDLIVYYYSNLGLIKRDHKYHGVVHAWDIPLLDGYSYKFLPNMINDSKWNINSIQPYLNISIIKELYREKFDAIIIHSYQYPSDWIAFLIAKFIKTSILFYGEIYPRNYQALSIRIARKILHRTMLRGSDACLGIGSVAMDEFRFEYNISEEKLFLAPYAVDNDYFISSSAHWKLRKKEIKSKYRIPKDIPVVLCVAGMVPKKRQQDLIAAMKMLNIPARLILVGHGPLYDQVYDFCQNNLPDAILTGFINQSEIPMYYAMADIFVLPSLWEEFGLVVNEAMCAGLPIVASNTIAATRDLVIEGENGFTFVPGDISTLAHHLRILLDDKVMRYRFGQRSLEIISGWNYQQTVAGIQKALDYVVN